jgi:putative heme-binding domain-containing protein
MSTSSNRCWGFFALGLFACAAWADAPNELDLGVRTTPPLSTAGEQAKFHLPPGFEIQLVAAEPDINKPMNMAFDSVGRLWVTTSVEYPFPAKNRTGRDRLMIFEDFGPDGRARKVTEFADGLNIPIGVYPFRSKNASGRETWKAIVWSIPNIWLFEDTDGDGKADSRQPLYGPFDVSRDTHGNQASFRRGFDGWLYATHGYNNDSHVQGRDGNRVDMNSGNTYRMRLDGERVEHFTWGQVNPFGLAWDERGNLYSSDCHTAPVYQLLAGGYYPSFGKPHDGLGFAPVLMEHAHGSTAIDGFAYYSDDLWPAEYRDHVFVGNVMTSRLNHDRLEFHGSSPRAIEQPDFVVADDPWFRPVDDILGPDGALYIADFYNRIIGHYEVPLSHPGRDHDHGRIWRVVYRGDAAQPKLRPPALQTGLDGLVAELGSPNLPRRLLAMSEITDRFGSSARESIQKVIHQPAGELQYLHALWVAYRLGSPDLFNDLTEATKRPGVLSRVHAFRIATSLTEDRHRAAIATGGGRQLPSDVDALRRLAVSALQDSDGLVRRCAAQTLGAWPSADNLRPILVALGSADPADSHLVYVLRKALRDQLLDGDVFASLNAGQWSATEQAAFASVSISIPSAAASELLLRHLPVLASTQNPEPSVAEVLKHVARYAPESGLHQLAEFAQRQYRDDVDSQFSLFESVEKGIQQRGGTVPEAMKSWAGQLVAKILDGGDPAEGWYNVQDESAPTANPWDFESRSFKDGNRGKVLSSLPHGEALTGNLRSPSFPAPERLGFWLCGHDGFPDQPGKHVNSVRLRRADNHQVLREAIPPRNDVGQKVEWELTDVRNLPVYLEVADGDTGSAYAWLAIGQLQPATIPWPRVGLRRSADLLVSAAGISGRMGFVARAPALRDLAKNRQADVEARVAAVVAALALQPEPAIAEFSSILSDASQAPGVRERIGQMLAEVSLPSARASVVAALKTAPYRFQSLWAYGLSTSRDGAEAFLSAVEQGLVSPRILQSVGARNRLQAAKPNDWENRIARLTASLPPSDEARDKLIAERRSGYVRSHANPVEGLQVFRQTCAPCHQINGEGGLVGPQLTGVGNRGLDRLCEDVLDPNRNVDRAFRQTLFTLKNGDVVGGLFRREEGELIIAADATGKEFSIKRSDVQERKESETSLMPDNFGEAIPSSQFNHLMAYLLSQSGGK